MRGHITKRSKDSYSLKISLGKDNATGKYKYQWVTVQGSKKDAEKRLSELLHQKDTGLSVRLTRQTLADYLKDWLKDTAYPNMTSRTFEGYQAMIKRHIIPCLGQITLTQLRPQHIQRLYGTLLATGKARTCEYCHFTLRKSLRDAVRMGILAHNPTDALQRPRVARREMSIMSDRDIHLFLEFARSTEYYPLFYTLLFTGLRRNEALALRWSDIDLLMTQLSVSRFLLQLVKGQVGFSQPKTSKSRRVIALSPSIVSVLREHREAQEKLRQTLELELSDNDLVFCHYDGTPYRPDTISHAWRKLAIKTGITVRLHDARHTHASLMLKGGVHPKIVQERLGHATISTTLDTYSHVVPGLQQAAANRFDEIIFQSKEPSKEAIN